MRLLALVNDAPCEYKTLIIDKAEYDNDSKGVGFYTKEGTYYFIRNVSLEDSNNICKDLAYDGFCDATSYGVLIRLYTPKRK